ncbi:hypothetical protein DXA64_06705 [Collinsella sp. OF03-4AA]|nr:hypothetical protein DXA64_06705 [Collinsella sp. OF03-4AA]
MKARLDNLRCVDMRQSNERGFLDAHLEQSFKNVPNDHRIRSKTTPQVEDGQRATSRANKLA